MRIIYLLALFSAFFVSSAPPKHPSHVGVDMNDLVSPDFEDGQVTFVSCSGMNGFQSIASMGACTSNVSDYISGSLAKQYEHYSFKVGPTTENRRDFDSGFHLDITTEYYFCIVRPHNGYCTGWNTQSLSASGTFMSQQVPTCPHEDFPEHTQRVQMSGSKNNIMCGKPRKDNGENCPNPSDDDPFVSGTSNSGSITVCYDNRNGTQCQIETNADGSYYLPKAYGTQEPSACIVPDPTDKIKDPDAPPTTEPTEPTLPTDPTGGGGNGTPETPTDPDDPIKDEGDDTDKVDPIDALNQVNDNLVTLIDNNTAQNETHSQLYRNQNQILDHIKNLIKGGNETQLETNQILGPMTENIGKTVTATNTLIEEQNTTTKAIKEQTREMIKQGEAIKERLTIITDQIKLIQPCTGPDCEAPCTGPNCETPCTGPDCETPCTGPDCETPCTGPDCETPCTGPDCETPCTGPDCETPPPETPPITGTSERRTGSFSELFKESDVNQIKSKSETKQEDIRTLLDDISGEVTSVLDVSPNLSGGYESRSISLHGQSIDISVSRFSSFYQMLAAPLMLVATMTALFVLLREK